MKENEDVKVKNPTLKNYKEFCDVVSKSEDKEMQVKATAEYIVYIKKHDKKAYENYLSYSTYLHCI